MATKVGVIGAGGMLQYHAAGFRQAHAEIVAVADPAPGAAKKAAEKWGIPHHYESVDAMLKDRPELQAVSVIVPNKFHAPLAIQCLNAGKHVLLEKPIATTLHDADEMIAAALDDAAFVPPRVLHVGNGVGRGFRSRRLGRRGGHQRAHAGDLAPAQAERRPDLLIRDRADTHRRCEKHRCENENDNGATGLTCGLHAVEKFLFPAPQACC